MRCQNLIALLMDQRDADYGNFMARLIPTVSPETILGVRTPQLRRIAREIEDGEVFLEKLPHTYFEENQIHAFLLEGKGDFDEVISYVNHFLPWVDNWATCDQLRPGVFSRYRAKLLPYIHQWLASEHPYTVRFGIEMLMVHFLGAEFDPAYPELVASVHSEEYYVKMMIAWYFASGLSEQFDTFYPYLEQRRLEPWTHRKAIQKAVESNRISPEQKMLLKQLRRTKQGEK